MVLACSIKYGVFNETNASIASTLMFFGRWRLPSLIKARLQGCMGDVLGATQQLTERVGGCRFSNALALSASF
jgi:cobalamin synthase